MPEAIISAKGTEAPTVRSGRFTHLLGLDEAEHARTEPDAQPAYRGKDASAMTCETSTR